MTDPHDKINVAVVVVVSAPPNLRTGSTQKWQSGLYYPDSRSTDLLVCFRQEPIMILLPQLGDLFMIQMFNRSCRPRNRNVQGSETGRF